MSKPVNSRGGALETSYRAKAYCQLQGPKRVTELLNVDCFTKDAIDYSLLQSSYTSQTTKKIVEIAIPKRAVSAE